MSKAARAKVERGIFGPWSGTIGNVNFYVLRWGRKRAQQQISRIAQQRKTSDQDKGG